MESTIKLKLTEQAKTKNKSQLIIDKFIKACINLDVSIFEPLIEENQLFQDLDKYRFLQSMKDLFDFMKIQEIQKMELKLAKCQGCQCGHVTHEFHAEGYLKFAYILLMEEDKLIDIFRCNFSSSEEFNSFPF